MVNLIFILFLMFVSISQSLLQTCGLKNPTHGPIPSNMDKKIEVLSPGLFYIRTQLLSDFGFRNKLFLGSLSHPRPCTKPSAGIKKMSLSIPHLLPKTASRYMGP